VMACPYSKTQDGFEIQFGCNHLAHFLLMKLLTPKLLGTAKKTQKPSRFVALSSCAAAEMTMGSSGMANVDFDDLNWEKREYNREAAYQQSKLANYLHAFEASKKHPADKLISVSLHPGWVQSNLDKHAFDQMFGTNIVGRGLASLTRKAFLMSGDMIPAFDGAQTTLHCILQDAEKVESGAFYSQFGIYKDAASKKGGWPMTLPNPNATPEAATKLWTESEKLVQA